MTLHHPLIVCFAQLSLFAFHLTLTLTLTLT